MLPDFSQCKQTRLISIVSKPIKVVIVVVVIVVVVFVKVKLGQKIFWSKSNPCPKSVGSKKNMRQKKVSSPKMFWSKIKIKKN